MVNIMKKIMGWGRPRRSFVDSIQRITFVDLTINAIFYTPQPVKMDMLVNIIWIITVSTTTNR